MRTKHLIAGAVTIAAVAGGTAGALAATDDQKAAEQSVLADAAKQLGVSSDELRSALSKAEDAQLDADVKAGRITQAQADEIRAHRQADGTVLELGDGGPGHHGPGHGGPGGRFLFSDAAKALGLSERSLMTQLRDGKSLATIAKAQGKTLADVKAAVKKAATARLDADLKAGRITQAQHDEEVAELDEEVDHLDGFGDHEHEFHGPDPARG
jgi:hypothetical protein